MTGLIVFLAGVVLAWAQSTFPGYNQFKVALAATVVSVIAGIAAGTFANTAPLEALYATFALVWVVTVVLIIQSPPGASRGTLDAPGTVRQRVKDQGTSTSINKAPQARKSGDPLTRPQTIRPKQQPTSTITYRSPQTEGPALVARGLLSDHRTSPGDADSPRE